MATKKKRSIGKNATSWRSGQSGNPKGRPKKELSITSLTKEIGEWAVPPTILAQYKVFFPNLPTNATCAQVLAARNFLKALDLKQGDVMSKEIWERFDGKVPFPVSGPDGGPVRFKHDLSSLSAKELDIFERLLSKCQTEDEA